MTLMARSCFPKGRKQNRQIVLVEPYGLGDVVSIQPLVGFLSGHGWKIHIVAQDRWKPVLENIDITWAGVSGSWATMGLLAFFKTCLRLRKEIPRGAVGIDPRGDIRTLFLFALAGCRKVYSLDHYLGTDRWIPAVLAELIPDRADVLQRWEITKGFAEAIESPVPSWPKPHLNHLANPVIPQDPRRIGIIPVAPWKGKHWKSSCWATLIGLLKNKGFEPILIFGPGQRDEAIFATAESQVECAEAENVRELVDVLQSCRAIVTLDTGPMHVASALNIPTVALFGSGQLPLWGPFSDQSAVIVSKDFPKMSIHQTQQNVAIGEKSMGDISVDVVCNAFFSLLSSTASTENKFYLS